MNSIDEWMKRELGNSPAESSKEKPKQDSSKKKGLLSRFKKGNSQKKKGLQSRDKSQKNSAQNSGNTGNKGRKPNNRKSVPAKAPKKAQILKGKLKVIPLGGLNEVGKNMMALEYEEDIVIIDMGFEFPSADLFGIDYVIPDVSYLEENKHRIRGVLLTHGHLDHIGGVPYILPKLGFPPVYSLPLTLGLVEHRLKEFKLDKMAKLNKITSDDKIRLGKMTASFFRVAHSIPDCLGIIIDSPAGKIVHTGDFKFDETPARNMKKDEIHKMEALGKQNVLALFCESTNALKPGHSISEKTVGETLEKVVGSCPGRCVIASFSSQVGRIQQIIDAAAKHGRKVYVSGRSMITNIEIAAKLGYLFIPKGLIYDVKKYKQQGTRDEETLILTTGSQGEPVSALTRISRGEHSHVTIQKGDTIVLSSSPIPGNELAINTVINNLSILGARVIHNQLMEVHTSGHGKQDELSRMINYIKPKYLIPIHGEYYMRQGLTEMARARCEMPTERMIMLQNGDVLHIGDGKVEKAKESVETKYILIDGLGEGHVGSMVITDRSIMSENGALIILIYVNKKTGRPLRGRHPDIVSRGFIYMHESEQITREISEEAMRAYKKIIEKDPKAKRNDIKRYVKQSIDKYTHRTLERRPLIVPLIIES